MHTLFKTRLALFILCLVTFSFLAQESSNTIKGMVSDLGQPLTNVNIAVKGTGNGVNTDSNGKYTITAKPRDILVFTHVGMRTVNIIVEDVTKTLNIEMIPRVEELDEVVVETKKKSQIDLREEYATNRNIIKTSIGYIDKERVGYSLRMVDGADLNPGAPDILSALDGKFPELTVRTAIDPISGTPERGVYMRGGNFGIGQPRPAVYEVDGSIFTSAPLFVPISSIDRLAIVKGHSSMARYGNVAAGGLIIINTKEGSRQYAIKRDTEPMVNSNAAYVSKSKIEREPPKYMVELQNRNFKTDALKTYEEQKKLYQSSPYYFLDVYSYFSKKWKDSTVSKEIQDDFKIAAADNPNALKAMAYIQEEEGNRTGTLETYKDILKLRPRYAQSYRDLANAFVLTGDFKKALNLYARYETSRQIDTITTALNPINSIIRTESNTMAALHDDLLNLPETMESDIELGQTRLFFEWNNSEAEFVLQFVKPDFSFLTWNHSLEANPNRITDEKLEGYSSEQFLVDGSVLGRWYVNLRYFGNKGYDPTYLKTTVSFDYGLPTQQDQVRVLKLVEKNINSEILSFVNNPSVSN